MLLSPAWIHSATQVASQEGGEVLCRRIRKARRSDTVPTAVDRSNSASRRLDSCAARVSQLFATPAVPKSKLHPCWLLPELRRRVARLRKRIRGGWTNVELSWIPRRRRPLCPCSARGWRPADWSVRFPSIPEVAGSACHQHSSFLECALSRHPRSVWSGSYR